MGINIKVLSETEELFCSDVQKPLILSTFKEEFNLVNERPHPEAIHLARKNE